MDVACLSEYRYEKYYGKQQVSQNDTYSVLVEEKKKQVRAAMIKGYMKMLTDFK
jgi:hypothetical protein